MENKIPNTHKEVLELLNENSMSVIIGGFLRDLYLNREPEDVDFLTTLTPEELEVIFPDLTWTETGREFGVTRTKFKNYNYEFFSVSPDEFLTSLKQRDFTMNSLFFDGEKIVGDQNSFFDIKHKVLKPYEDFYEHANRSPQIIPKTFRFISELGFYPSEYVIDGVKKSSKLIDEVSDSRINKEGYRIIRGSNNFLAIRTMIKSGIIKSGSDFTHLSNKQTPNINNSIPQRLAYLQYYFGEDVIKQFLSFFRISEDFLNQTNKLIEYMLLDEINKDNKNYSTVLMMKRYLYDDKKEEVIKFIKKQKKS